MNACAASVAELNHDHQSAALGAQEYFIAVEQMERVSDAAARILAGHAIPSLRPSSRWEKSLEKTVPCLEKINFRMIHITSLVAERTTDELCIGLFRGEPSALSSMQRLVRDCAEEVAFDALNLDSNPFINIEALREAAGERQ